jgi:hypothetical protein
LSPLEIAHWIRLLQLGEASAAVRNKLRELGLANLEDELTPQGLAIEHAYWVAKDPTLCAEAMTRTVMAMPEVDALVQSLHGRGSVPVAGALYVLVRHRLATDGDMTALRALLDVLNATGIATYSRKHQTVRICSARNDDHEPLLRVFEPSRPYSNLRHLRDILRTCKTYIWWADQHLSRTALEPLVDEADAARIREIRLLSGPANISDRAKADFDRFDHEMANLGITTEWRVVIDAVDRLWHDRFIVTDGQSWNVPPVNTIYKNDYSEAWTTTQRPPFDIWWSKGHLDQDRDMTTGSGISEATVTEPPSAGPICRSPRSRLHLIATQRRASSFAPTWTRTRNPDLTIQWPNHETLRASQQTATPEGVGAFVLAHRLRHA